MPGVVRKGQPHTGVMQGSGALERMGARAEFETWGRAAGDGLETMIKGLLNKPPSHYCSVLSPERRPSMILGSSNMDLNSKGRVFQVSLEFYLSFTGVPALPLGRVLLVIQYSKLCMER